MKTDVIVSRHIFAVDDVLFELCHRNERKQYYINKIKELKL